jgi:hypothetical protein
MGTKGHPYRGVSLFVPLRWSGDRKGNVPFCPFLSPLSIDWGEEHLAVRHAAVGERRPAVVSTER